MKMCWNKKKYLLLMLGTIFLSACDKKEILQGQREDLFKTYGVNFVDQKGKNSVVDLGKSQIASSYTDIAGNKQHNAIHHKMNETPKLIWKQVFKNAVQIAPVIFKGKIYAIDAKGDLLCLSQLDGALLWKKSIAKQGGESIFSGGISADGDVLYITTNIGKVLAVDSVNQKVVWEKQLQLPLNSAPLFVDGKLIVTDVANTTFALDSKDGSLLWEKTNVSVQTLMLDVGSPAFVDKNHSVICAYSSGDFVSLNLNTGIENWFEILFPANIDETGSAIAHIAVSPVVSNGKALISMSESKMALVDVESGMKLWEQNLGTQNCPVIVGEWAFVLSNKGELVCLSMKNGALKWMADAKSAFKNENEKFSRGPFLVNGDIVAFDNVGNILYFNAKDGAFKKKIQINKSRIEILQSMIVDETIFVVAKDPQNMNRVNIYAIK